MLIKKYYVTFRVTVSKASLGADLDIGNIFEIIERVEHPDYKNSSNYNDISLLKIDRPLVQFKLNYI